MNTRQSTNPVQLEVTPRQTLIDEPVAIQLSGLRPGQHVVLSARTRDGYLFPWVSRATFCADEQGRINVSQQPPVAGSYDGVDASGLFWSMTLQDASEGALFTKTRATPLAVTITAESEGQELATCRIERMFTAPGIRKRVLEGPALVGTLFLPAQAGPHPCALLLNGSDGGMHEHSAALLASRGYAALALAYFGVENCPKHLIKIPLEYFERAITWLQAQKEIDGNRLAVIGLSRGGELALLLGATFPALKAVVAGAPGSFVFAGLRNYRSVPESAWTYRGKPLSFVSTQSGDMSGASFFRSVVLRHEPLRLRKSFQRVLEKSDPVHLQEAAIPVEKIAGPVLLISGTDDQVWPSSAFAERVVSRFKQQQFAYPFEHLCYENAGHFVCFPYALPSLPPWIERTTRAGITITSAFGGTPASNAHAASASWLKIQAFLRESL